MTLFSVGFKVDAKAVTITPKADDYWDDNASAYLQIDDSFPGKNGDKEYLIEFRDSDVTFNASTGDDGSYEISGLDDDVWDFKGTNGFTAKIPIPGTTHEELINDDRWSKSDGNGNSIYIDFPITVTVTDGDTGAQKYKKSTNWKELAYRVDLHALHGKTDLTKKSGSKKGVTFEIGENAIEFGSNFYLLLNDTVSVNVVDEDGILQGLEFNKWTPEAFVNDNSMPGEIIASKKAVVNVTANYTSDSSSLQFKDEDDNDAFPRSVALGYWSEVLSYELLDGGDLSELIDTVYLGKTKLAKNSEYQVDDSNFRFKAAGSDASSSDKDYKKLTITLKSGAKYTYDVVVADMNKMDYKPASGDTLYALVSSDTGTVVTPTYKYGSIINYEFVPASGYFDVEYNEGEEEFTLVGEHATTGKTLKITPYFDIDAYEKSGDYTTNKNVIKTYTPTVMVFDTGSAVDIKDIYVNEGLTIWLWSFTDDKDTNAVIIENGLESYVKFGLKDKNSGSVTGKTLVGKIGDITIKGVKKADARTGVSIQPGDNSPSVTVYPKPNITKDSSSTSSSSSSGTKTVTHSITVTMPAGVYHGNSTKSIMDDDLDKMELFYVTSSGEEKSLGTKSLSTVSKDSLIKKWEGKVSIPSDAKAIIAYAYPDGSKDSDVYYRLDLDSSSSSTSSSSGSSSSSSSKSGGGSAEGGSGSEYDDVPKTGESKTDIWVLWTVLFIAILGAGFMIYKRFGLVRAIAEAEEEFAAAEHEERVEAARKEKEDKINMLKDLRNL